MQINYGTGHMAQKERTKSAVQYIKLGKCMGLPGGDEGATKLQNSGSIASLVIQYDEENNKGCFLTQYLYKSERIIGM
jgi:hypothetical protein